MGRWLWVVLSLTVAAPLTVQADEPAPPPRGPADLINKARQANPARDLARGAPAPGRAHDAMFRAPGAMASAVPDSAVPVGTIAVEVRDEHRAPVQGIEVVLGIMGSLGQRSAKAEKTDAQGEARFQQLATGSKQAYRVNVSRGGAKFSSTPFRLGPSSGYRVRVGLRPVTRDGRMVFQMVGQTMVELRDDRLHVTQQSRLTNAGSEVYVFPSQGALISLPEGFLSFQAQKVMTDQRLAEDPGKGARLFGSLPPGTVTLTWSYDLKRGGSRATIPIDVPWRTYQYRVIADAPEGMKLKVQGFPAPERIRDRGRQLWITQLRKTATEPPLEKFTLRLEGIPGPGPGRWVAVGFAVLALLAAAWAALRPGAAQRDRGGLLEAQKEALLAEAVATERQRAAGEIGPQYRARRMDQIVTALAAVLRDQEGLQGPSPAGRK